MKRRKQGNHWGYLIAMFLVLVPHSLKAEVSLPSILSDGMVLQRDMTLPIWGWADPAEEVTVRIAGQSHRSVADSEGRWQVKLDPLSIGDPVELNIQGVNRLAIKDILIGDVWLCSGQSNMYWPVKSSLNGDLEIAKANRRDMRLISITTKGSQEPVETCRAEWLSASPESVASFSAVGYFFGCEIQDQVDVPIGLIANAWGGSTCEAWIRRDHLQTNPRYDSLLELWRETEATYDVPSEQAEYKRQLAQWEKDCIEAKNNGTSAPKKPRWLDPISGRSRPANLYHGRLGPVMPFGIRGVIWYQGEANTYRAFQYRDLFPLMIRTWREEWGQGDFPFYWAQLADYKSEYDQPSESDWAELREAQTLTLDQVPNVGQAVIIDLGDGSNIHPQKKIEVGRRLARIALAKTYGREIAYKSPRFDSIQVKGDSAIIKFQDCEDGLKAFDSFEVHGFTIAGSDRKWRNAKARIMGDDKVVVTSEEVLAPVAVRYAWANNPVCNLQSRAGLPVTPFRTDDWPGVTNGRETPRPPISLLGNRKSNSKKQR